MPTKRTHLLVLSGFVVAATVLYAGTSILRLNSVCIPQCGPDPSLYTWMFRWMAYAITHGHNPFVSPLIGTPEGTPLYWVTTVAAQAFAALPLTFLLGARASYNLSVLLGVGLAAWSVYLLCLEIVEEKWPAIAGGVLFLLSSYLVYEVVHMNLLFVAPVVLLARLTIRYGRGLVPIRRFALTAAALLVVQFFSSTEIFATMALFGAIGGALYLWTTGGFRRDLTRQLLVGVGAAYLICLMVVSPFLWRALQTRPAKTWVPITARSVDLLEVVVPGESTAVGFWADQFRRRIGIESGYPDSGAQGYLGIPVLVLLVVAWRRRGEYPTMLLPFIGTAMVFSLGPQIEVFRRIRFPGPYALFEHLPVIGLAFPKRFTLYAWIGIAVLLALWLRGRLQQDRQRTLLWLLIGAVVLLPGQGLMAPPERLQAGVTPPFFTAGSYRWFIQPDDSVLGIAPPAMPLRWQVATDFRFRLAEGYLGPYAPWGFLPFGSDRRGNDWTRPAVAAVIARRDVDWVVLPNRSTGRVRARLLEVADGPPIPVGGVSLYHVGGDRVQVTPGEPSLAAQAAYRRGMAAYADGRFTDAAGEFRRVLAIRPTHRFAHLQMGRIYLAYGDEELAEVHLRAAMVENPDFVAPMVALARLWSSERRSADADALYRRIFLVRPSSLTYLERVRAERVIATFIP